MIKIGDVYLDEASIQAIMPGTSAPSCGDPASCGGSGVERRNYTVYLSTGKVIIVTTSDDELQRLLTRAGLLQQPDSCAADGQFTADELEELASVFRIGYRFAARDHDGKVFAYKGKPIKGKYTWQHDEAKRLHCDYAALAFEDVEPLDLTALFVGDGVHG